MREFIFKPKKSDDEFYDIRNSLTEDNITETMLKLKPLIEKEEAHFDAYLMQADLMESIGEKRFSYSLISYAYGKAYSLVCDDKGNWPDKLEWSQEENRPVIQTFITRGLKLWERKKRRRALSLFRKLLKSDLTDYTGVRFYMLAIMEKMSEKEFFERFDKSNLGSDEINKWFDEIYPKHEDKFNQYLDECFNVWRDSIT